MKKYLISVLVLSALLPSFAFADLGRKSTITLNLTVDKNLSSTTPLSGSLICYDTFVTGAAGLRQIGGPNNTDGKDYQYIKGLIENGYSCVIGGKTVVHKLPTSFAVLYPVYGDYPIWKDTSSLDIKPILYGPMYLGMSGFSGVGDYKIDATINAGGSLILNNRSIQTTEGRSYFLMSFFATIIIELFAALLYIIRKKIFKKVLFSVLLANIVSFPIHWFIFPLLLRGVTDYLIISETFVVLIEALIIYLLNKNIFTVKKALIFSIILNLTSFILGGFLVP
jgi:hypothetical protein